MKRGRALAAALAVLSGGALLSAAVAAGDLSNNSVTPECQTDQQTTATECSGGWYTTPVRQTWSFSPLQGSSPSPGCNVATGPSGEDINQTVTCDVSWSSGNPPYIPDSYQLQVELSNPTASALLGRPPDSNGWYNHPVAVSFTGSAFSGIASCSAPTTYAGPDAAGVTIAGSCTDDAGKVANASLTLNYDATPPALTASASPGDGSVALTWDATTSLAPISTLQIARTPGFGRTAADVLHQASSGSYQDKEVRNGVRYTYTVTAVDQAGNDTTQTLTATPGPRLLSPGNGTQVTAPPLLTWTAVPKATYYNVQVYNGRKVLSAWPSHARFHLSRRWRFRGRTYKLKQGRYRWYVWPGFGRRSAARYGKQVGTGTFVVAKHKAHASSAYVIARSLRLLASDAIR